MAKKNLRKTLPLASLTVPWSILPVNSADFRVVPAPSPQNAEVFVKPRPVEASSGLPPGTLAVLERAFAANLTRRDAWLLEETSGAVRAATVAAARIFKRGVPFVAKDAPIADKSLAPSQGSYTIDVVRRWPEEGLFADGDFIVVDAALRRPWGKSFGRQVAYVSLTEATKTLAAAGNLIRASRGARHWVIVGGGILCDVAAFAATLAGAEFTLMPTTLLAMVDAAVGGKTGVNFPPYGKNQVGAFSFPRRVVVATEVLATLPQRQWRAGQAECVKHGLLSSKLLLAAARMTKSRLGTSKFAKDLASLIALKAEVVARDPSERGERAILNLGHTLAHALEGLAAQRRVPSRNRILHGEAVGLGILFCVHLALVRNLLSAAEHAAAVKAISRSSLKMTKGEFKRRVGVPMEDDARVREALYKYVLKDKKAISSKGEESEWVLLQAVGRVHQEPGKFTTTCTRRDFDSAWRMLCEG